MKKFLLITLICSILFTVLSSNISSADDDGELVLPADLTAIGDMSFYLDTSVRTVIPPEGLKTIGYLAFAFSELEAIYLPESVTWIANNAFDCCSDNLTAVVIKDSYAYNYCIERGINYYVLEDREGIMVDGLIFLTMRNNIIPDAKVELHIGVKRLYHTYSGTNYKMTEEIIENGYEEDAISECMTDEDGYFEVFIPEDDEPSDENGYYYYTIVISKEGYITRYYPLTFSPSQGLPDIDTNVDLVIGLSDDYITVNMHHNGLDFDTSIVYYPYDAFYIYSGSWYDTKWEYNRFTISIGDTTIRTFYAPAFSSGKYWLVSWYNCTLFHVFNRVQSTSGFSGTKEELSEYCVLPSWMKGKVLEH